MKNLVFILAPLLFTSCATFKRCERKFGNTVTDTVTVVTPVTVHVPKDSAVLRVVTDTATLIREVRQGRATVRIIREPTYTTVYAKCDSVAITKNAIAKIPQKIVKVGVSRFYRYGFFALLILLGVLGIAFWLSRLFTVQITKK